MFHALTLTTVSRWISRWLIGLALLSVPSAASVAELPVACDAALSLLPNDVHRLNEGSLGEAHCYRLDLPSTGLLHLSLSLAGWSTSRARLGVLNVDGDPAALEIIERSATEWLAMAPAGTFFLEVTAEDPRHPLPSYRLGSRFVEPTATSDKSETDGELEPDPYFAYPGGKNVGPAKSETDGELEPDPYFAYLGSKNTGPAKSETDGELEPDPYFAYLGGKNAGPAKSETDGELEPDPYFARVDYDDTPSLRESLCHGADGDLHGDTFACATNLRRRAKGQLNNGWGDDVDMYRFHLRGWQTVEILTKGGIDTHGELFDAAGQRLAAVDEGGEGHSFRLVRTLGPGIYFIRVEGVAGASGAYSLEVLKLDR